MLNENLKRLRKQKGLSQEEMAVRLNVVRQTVSKWEKGLSVPDADMLIKISNLLEVSVGELLGKVEVEEESRNEVVEQLVRINEQLAVRNRRMKTVLKIVAGIIIGWTILALFFWAANGKGFGSMDDDRDNDRSTGIEGKHCSLEGGQRRTVKDKSVR